MGMINEIFDKKSVNQLKIGDELPFDVIEDVLSYMRNDSNFYRSCCHWSEQSISILIPIITITYNL